MSNQEEDSEKLFHTYYESYFAAKQRDDRANVQFFALLGLAKLHEIVGNSDQIKAARLMHDLMGFLSETQTREMYDELRNDARIT
jgi:hypothetical protein